MILKSPFFISAGLNAAIKVGGAEIEMEEFGYDRDDRTIYAYRIALPDGTIHESHDLKSGCGRTPPLQEMFSTLLSFMGACGESLSYASRTGKEGENADLFPLPVAKWCAAHSDELSMLQLELDEMPGLIADKD